MKTVWRGRGENGTFPRAPEAPEAPKPPVATGESSSCRRNAENEKPRREVNEGEDEEG